MTPSIILNQMILMLFLTGIGWLLARHEKMTLEGAKQLSSLLLYVCTPAIIISSLNIEYSYEMAINLGIMAVLSMTGIFAGIIVARIFFGLDNGIERFAVIFSNSGFIGIPIVRALYGESAIIYLSVFIVCFNVMSWTYGLSLLKGKKEPLKPREFVLNPAILGCIVGILLFVSPFTLQGVMKSGVDILREANTLVAMLVLGIHMYFADLKEIVRNKKSLVVCMLRLLIVPLSVSVLMIFVPESYRLMKDVLLIAIATPVAMTLSLFAHVNNKNFLYSSSIVSVSTILSIITLPLMMAIAQSIW